MNYYQEKVYQLASKHLSPRYKNALTEVSLEVGRYIHELITEQQKAVGFIEGQLFLAVFEDEDRDLIEDPIKGEERKVMIKSLEAFIAAFYASQQPKDEVLPGIDEGFKLFSQSSEFAELGVQLQFFESYKNLIKERLLANMEKISTKQEYAKSLLNIFKDLTTNG